MCLTAELNLTILPILIASKYLSAAYIARHEHKTAMVCYTTLMLLVVIISVLGIIGNVIAFCAFGKRNTQNASTTLLRFLAFVDSCLLLFLMFNTIEPHLGNNIPWLCYVRKICIALNLYEVSRTAAIWTPVLIGVHRYIIVCKPLWVTKMCTVGKARRHSLYVLILSVIVNLPTVFVYEMEWTMSNHTEVTVYCGISLTCIARSPWFTIAYRKVYLIGLINYVIPDLLLMVITLRLLQSLRSFRQRQTAMRGGQDERRDDRSVDRMVIVVLLVFMICHTGYPVATILCNMHGTYLRLECIFFRFF